MTQVAACATSVIAFHDALRLIAHRRVRRRRWPADPRRRSWPMGVAALANMGALSKRNDSPETASRPFDATRDGFVLGEGAGVVVVESRGARARPRRDADRRDPRRRADGRRVPHLRARTRPGAGQARAMTNALRNAGVAPDEVDWIVAHGTSTSLNDATETRAIKAAYGSAASTRAISSPKSMIGHLVGAAGDRVRAGGAGRHPRPGHLADRQPAHPRPGVRPRLRAAGRAQGEGRHGGRQRLRLRRPERGHDLPPLRGVAAGARGAWRSGAERTALEGLEAGDDVVGDGPRPARRVVVQHLDGLGRGDEPCLARGPTPRP